MAFRPEYLAPHLISIALSILLAVAAWKRPNLGRFSFATLFAWAAFVNLRTALATPEVYLEYAKLTESPTYRAIIEGPFARHVTAYVAAIAVGQAAIAAAFLGRGALVKLGALGAIVFLVAIAPLGVGSAFPSTLVGAGAAAVLLRRRFDRTLLREIRDALGRSRIKAGMPTPPGPRGSGA